MISDQLNLLIQVLSPGRSFWDKKEGKRENLGNYMAACIYYIKVIGVHWHIYPIFVFVFFVFAIYDIYDS